MVRPRLIEFPRVAECRASKPNFLFVRVALLCLMVTTRLLAHPMDDAVVEVRLEPPQARFSFLLAYPLVASFDDNGDRVLSGVEVEQHGAELARLLEEHLGLIPGGRLQVQAEEQAVALETHTRLRATADWSARADTFTLVYSLWPPNADGPRCFLVVQQGERSLSAVLSQEEPRFSLPLTWQGRLRQRATPPVMGAAVVVGLGLLALGQRRLRWSLVAGLGLAGLAAWWLVKP